MAAAAAASAREGGRRKSQILRHALNTAPYKWARAHVLRPSTHFTRAPFWEPRRRCPPRFVGAGRVRRPWIGQSETEGDVFKEDSSLYPFIPRGGPLSSVLLPISSYSYP